jgi:hypothetical protein
MMASITKLALALGFTMALGSAFVPLGCGTSEEAVYPPERPAVQASPRLPDLPADIQKQLKDCIPKTSAPFPPAEKNTYAVMFNVHAARSGRVRAVEVHDSTLGGHPIEACLAKVLEGTTLPLQDLEPLAAPVSRHPVAPHDRGLLGNVGLGSLVRLLFAPAVLESAGIILVVAVVVLVAVEVSDALSSAPAASVAPTATALPTTAATSVPQTRRYPDQTCEDDVLDRLQNEKWDLCDKGFALNCKRQKGDEEIVARIPCSKILRSLQQRLACLSQRNLIQEKCFGGVPDAAHKGAIEQVQNGIAHCEALKLLNCAKGHPMSGL